MLKFVRNLILYNMIYIYFSLSSITISMVINKALRKSTPRKAVRKKKLYLAQFYLSWKKIQKKK